MRKFKNIMCIMLCILCIVSITACGGADNTPSPEALVSEIKTYTDESIVWASLESDKITGYFGFSGEKARELSAVINDDDEKCDIIAAFVIENETDRLAAIEAIGRSLTTTAKTFETTNNSESQKLKSCIIYVKDDTLITVVSSNIEKIKTLLTGKGFKSAV